MMELYIPLSIIVLGLIIGSFLTVCIYRIPLGRYDHEDLGQEDAVQPEPKPETKLITISDPPRSFCPKCQAQLRWSDNIPLVSWLLARGRCAYCQAPISARYPAVELLSALSALLCYGSFGLTPTALVIYAFVASLIVISFIDYDYFIIPNVISLPGTLICFLLAVLNEFTDIFNAPIVPGVRDSILGILVGGGFLWFVSEGYFRMRGKEGLGMGDVKLLFMTGALLGMPGSLFTIFVGSLLGSIIGIGLIIFGGRKMSQHLPFGPYLALGTIFYLFDGSAAVGQIIQYLVAHFLPGTGN